MTTGARRRRSYRMIPVAAACLALSGCLTIGRPFDDSRVQAIETGKTTRTEIETIFGQPYRTGLEDGNETWTYLNYRLRAIGAQSTTDLYVRFNPNGTVKSYAFNTNAPKK